jgi:hypothetical protein
MFNHYNIMLNIKNLFITTGLSMLFGVYSIYAFIEYLKLLDKINKHYKLEFDNINRVINVINADHNNLSLKYNIIETKYNELNAKYDDLYVKNAELISQYNELIQTHNNLLNDVGTMHLNDMNSLDDPLELPINDELLESLTDDLQINEYSQQLQTMNENLQYKINYGYDYNDVTDASYNNYNDLEERQVQTTKQQIKRAMNYEDVHINKIIQENFIEPKYINTLIIDYDNAKPEYHQEKQSSLINYPYEDVPSLNSSYSSLSNLSQHSGNSCSKPENYKVLVRSKSNSVIGDLWIGLTQKFF